MLTELRLSLRMLLKQPGFMLIAVLTLALGIGATSASWAGHSLRQRPGGSHLRWC